MSDVTEETTEPPEKWYIEVETKTDWDSIRREWRVRTYVTEFTGHVAMCDIVRWYKTKRGAERAAKKYLRHWTTHFRKLNAERSAQSSAPTELKVAL